MLRHLYFRLPWTATRLSASQCRHASKGSDAHHVYLPRYVAPFFPEDVPQPEFLRSFDEILNATATQHQLCFDPDFRRVLDCLISERSWDNRSETYARWAFETSPDAPPEKVFRTLCSLNALVARLLDLSIPLTPQLAYMGMVLAARARSTSALWRYARACELHALSIKEADIMGILTIVVEAVETALFSGWQGQRAKAELLVLLTGYEDGVGRPGETRKTSFVRLYGYPGTPWTRRHLLPTVRRLGGAGAVHTIWLAIREKWSIQSVPEIAALESDHKARVVHDVVEQLILGEDPAQAWKVAQESGLKFNEIKDETWDLLIEHPDGMRWWNESLRRRVLRKYDIYLKKVEDELGIRWTGGEMGRHVFVDEDLRDIVQDLLDEEAQERLSTNS